MNIILCIYIFIYISENIESPVLLRIYIYIYIKNPNHPLHHPTSLAAIPHRMCPILCMREVCFYLHARKIWRRVYFLLHAW